MALFTFGKKKIKDDSIAPVANKTTATKPAAEEKKAPAKTAAKPATEEKKAPAKTAAKPATEEKKAPAKTAAKPATEEKKAPAKTAAKPAAEEKKAPAKTAAKPAEVETATPTKEEYTGRFEINKSKDGKKYFFNLYASNKVGIATSQMYSSAQSALNGIKSVIANAATAPIEDQSLKKYDTLPYPKWEIYIDNGGKYRFRLNASNGNCVCHSQGYTTKPACKNGIDSIIRSSRNAEIDKTYIAKKDGE